MTKQREMKRERRAEKERRREKEEEDWKGEKGFLDSFFWALFKLSRPRNC